MGAHSPNPKQKNFLDSKMLTACVCTSMQQDSMHPCSAEKSGFAPGSYMT